MLAADGKLADIVAAGARILECGCGPCIGQGCSPAEGTVSVRTFNRNFSGRTGTPNDTVFLASPETAVMAAICGVPTVRPSMPSFFIVTENRLNVPPYICAEDTTWSPALAMLKTL